jgi:hypothetical protein
LIRGAANGRSEPKITDAAKPTNGCICDVPLSIIPSQTQAEEDRDATEERLVQCQAALHDRPIDILPVAASSKRRMWLCSRNINIRSTLSIEH